MSDPASHPSAQPKDARGALVSVRPEIWTQWLPPLMQPLSIGRSVIVAEVLRAAQSPSPDSHRHGIEAFGWNICGSAKDGSSTDGGRSAGAKLSENRPGTAAEATVAAVIGERTGDTFQIHLAGTIPVIGLADGVPKIPLPALVNHFGEQLHRRWKAAGVRMAVYSTDPPRDSEAVVGTDERKQELPPNAQGDSSPDPADVQFRRAIGLQPLATLQYAAKSLDENGLVDASKDSPSDRRTICLEPMPRPDVVEDQIRFDPADEDLVQQTYRDTRDCPLMNQFRTAGETLRGYTLTDTYEPRWWFRVRDFRGGPPVGVCILARHLGDDSDAASVAEIVYMGLRPEARGRGLGRELLKQVQRWAVSQRAERLLVAFDAANAAAAKLYGSAGFEVVHREALEFWHEGFQTSPILHSPDST